MSNAFVEKITRKLVHTFELQSIINFSFEFVLYYRIFDLRFNSYALIVN
jgi:hypothetical protein